MTTDHTLTTESFDLLCARLRERAASLTEKTRALDVRRQEAFGASELAILGQAQLETAQPSVARDLVALGDALLFGFEVARRGAEPTLADVLTLHRVERGEHGVRLPIAPSPTGLTDPELATDLAELYRYYQNARVLSLRRTESGYLLALFQVGTASEDRRVFHFAVGDDGDVRYLGPRGERFAKVPASHDFEWTATTRDDHVAGRFGHVSIDGAVWVEAIGGDLTIKVEDDVESPDGVYAEPVEHADQTLDDAAIRWAKVGRLYLLEILPYREERARYFIFDTSTRGVHRVDAIGEACVRLPDEAGILFPGGYYDASGHVTRLSGASAGLVLERVVRAPGGEDVLYVFARPRDGHYRLLPYNVIEKKIRTPIEGRGYALLPDGTMAVLRARPDAEPGRLHPVQLWRTPFVCEAHEAARTANVRGFLSTLGNAELVGAIASATLIARLADVDAGATRQRVEDVVAACARASERHYWLSHEEAGAIGAGVQAIREAADALLAELDKVEAARADAAAEVRALATRLEPALAPCGSGEALETLVEGLAVLRVARGELLELGGARFVDQASIDALAARLDAAAEDRARATLLALRAPDAFAPIEQTLDALERRSASADDARAMGAVEAEIEALIQGLDALGDVVRGLDVTDATERTAALERLGALYGRANRASAALETRALATRARDASAELSAQLGLLTQGLAGVLARAKSPDACDVALGRVLATLEELDARFADSPELAAKLSAQRERIGEAFGARRRELTLARETRVAELRASAARVLEAIRRRAAAFEDVSELRSWLASDAMVLELRRALERLREAGDAVRAEELAGRLSEVAQGAERALRDARDLRTADGSLTLGRHRFAVEPTPLELDLAPKDGALVLTLSGTDYAEPVTDEALLAARSCWGRARANESADLYRAEYLAASMFLRAEREGTLAELRAARADGSLERRVRDEAAARFAEGYERGVHDTDAAAVLTALLRLSERAGALRVPASARRLAALFWADLTGSDEPSDQREGARLRRLGQSRARLARTFGRADHAALARALTAPLRAFGEAHGLEADAPASAAHLAEALCQDGGPRFVVRAQDAALADALGAHLEGAGQRAALEDELRDPRLRLADRLAIAEAWLSAFAPERAQGRADAAALLAIDEALPREVVDADTVACVPAVGAHPRVVDGDLEIDLVQTLRRAAKVEAEEAPALEAFRSRRAAVLAEASERLRLEALRPRVPAAFVRNRLIDEVYLPLVGDNLAKQIGAVGSASDRQGLLLLISPPGYGKTTLMEYVAAKVGLSFVKVDGPALGLETTSLDPDAAPHATARRELDKIGQALEMASNVMLYLDDVQHTSPALLSRFIPLCDGQRRIEGVYQGVAKSYDLRGKRFCVVMAANPFTQSGAKFRMPDMLANRADVHNLGDLSEAAREAFEASYIENALSVNPTLAPIAARSLDDARALMRVASGEETALAELTQDYPRATVDDAIAVLRHLAAVRDALTRVNAAYIRSASMADADRTEPPFLLQGSYRNMARIAAGVAPVMSAEELERRVDAHYRAEAQTLTSGAEQSLLKLAVLRGRASETERARWAEIVAQHRRTRSMGGPDADPATRVSATVASLGAELERITSAIRDAADRVIPETDYALE